MRVGIRASVVGTRRIDAAARTAASVVGEACAHGDSAALRRFWGTFVDELRAPSPKEPPLQTGGSQAASRSLRRS
jgi:hypothetical protein